MPLQDPPMSQLSLLCFVSLLCSLSPFYSNTTVYYIQFGFQYVFKVKTINYLKIQAIINVTEGRMFMIADVYVADVIFIPK